MFLVCAGSGALGSSPACVTSSGAALFGSGFFMAPGLMSSSSPMSAEQMLRSFSQRAASQGEHAMELAGESQTVTPSSTENLAPRYESASTHNSVVHSRFPFVEQAEAAGSVSCRASRVTSFPGARRRPLVPVSGTSQSTPHLISPSREVRADFT